MYISAKMVLVATKMTQHVNYIIGFHDTKYSEDWPEIDETVRSCFIQKYFQ